MNKLIFLLFFILKKEIICLNLDSSFKNKTVILESGLHEINDFIQVEELIIHSGAKIIFSKPNSKLLVKRGRFIIIENRGNEKIQFLSKNSFIKKAKFIIKTCEINELKNILFDGVGLEFFNVQNNIKIR